MRRRRLIFLKRRLRLADHAVSGSRTAIGHDVADLDFGVGGAGVVFLCASAPLVVAASKASTVEAIATAWR